MLRPLVLFDGNCPLCRREINHYIRIDKKQAIIWHDLHQSEQLLNRYNVSKKQAMQVLHSIDPAGNIIRGIPSFLLIWDHLPGYHYLATAIRLLRLESALEWAYKIFCRWRTSRHCQSCQ